jgi:hypothetical protein
MYKVHDGILVSAQCMYNNRLVVQRQILCWWFDRTRFFTHINYRVSNDIAKKRNASNVYTLFVYVTEPKIELLNRLTARYNYRKMVANGLKALYTKNKFFLFIIFLGIHRLSLNDFASPCYHHLRSSCMSLDRTHMQVHLNSLSCYLNKIFI